MKKKKSTAKKIVLGVLATSVIAGAVTVVAVPSLRKQASNLAVSISDSFTKPNTDTNSTNSTERELESVKNQLATIQTQLAEKEEKLNDSITELNQLKTTYNSLMEEKAILESKLTLTEEESIQKDEQIVTLNAQITELNTAIETKSQTISTQTEQILSYQTQIAELQATIEELSNQSSSTKELLTTVNYLNYVETKMNEKLTTDTISIGDRTVSYVNLVQPAGSAIITYAYVTMTDDSVVLGRLRFLSSDTSNNLSTVYNSIDDEASIVFTDDHKTIIDTYINNITSLDFMENVILNEETDNTKLVVINNRNTYVNTYAGKSGSNIRIRIHSYEEKSGLVHHYTFTLRPTNTSEATALLDAITSEILLEYATAFFSNPDGTGTGLFGDTTTNLGYSSSCVGIVENYYYVG